MKIETIIKRNGIFVLNYSARPKNNILMILMSKVSENEIFGKTIKPFFFNKGLNANNMMLVKNNEIVPEEEIIANIMNNYFTNITTHIKLSLQKLIPKRI